jgi:hypothetical protein
MAAKILMVDHPSVADLKRAIEHADWTIEDLKDSEFRRVERQMQQRDAGSIDAFVTEREERRYNAAMEPITMMQSVRHHFQKFLSNRDYVLGSVSAGSGLYRRKARNNGEQFILDWALIQIRPERYGRNEVRLILILYSLKL